jgi:hypothetical protein
LNTLFPANPIASNPIQLSKKPLDRWDPRFPPRAAAGTVHPSTLPIQKELTTRARLTTTSLPLGFPTGAGGADRVRTDDIRLAKAALSQLSYSPLLQDDQNSLARAPGDGGPR